MDHRIIMDLPRGEGDRVASVLAPRGYFIWYPDGHVPLNDWPWTVVISDHSDHIRWCMEHGIAVLGVERPAGEGEREPLPCDYIVQGADQVEEWDVLLAYNRLHGIPMTVHMTERTVIREFTMNDLDDLIGLYRLPHMTDYTPPLHPPEEEREILSAYIRSVYRYSEYGQWAVIRRTDGRLIGRAGIETTPRCRPDEAELMYMIATDCWGQGLATEVCRAIVDDANYSYGLTSIIARVMEDNQASIRVMEKLKFHEKQRESGIITFVRKLV